MKARKIVRTSIASLLIAMTLAVAIVANVMIPPNMNMINGYLGDGGTVTVQQPDTYTEDLDLQYNKADYTAEEIVAAEQALNEEILGEGAVLLKNDDNNMPFAEGTTFSFFGRSSTKMVGNVLYDLYTQMGMPADPGMTLRDAFQSRGFGVNETLWNFYDSGNGSSYGLGIGSLNLSLIHI